MVRSFPYWNQETNLPNINWNLFTNELNITTNTVNHYKRHRLGLTASIIGEIYHDSECAVEGCNSGPTEWYDEYWVDPITTNPTNNSEIGSGYLGIPISGSTFNNSIWRKDFQNGIVLLNQNITKIIIELDKTYRYINGTEAPTINKGGLANDTITIDGKDGIILLRSLCSNNPSNDPNCISICGDNICGTSETCSSCSQDCGVCEGDPSSPGGTGDPITSIPANETGCTENCDEEGIETINQINLDNDDTIEIEISGGQYIIINGGIHSVITIYNINEVLLTIIYGGDIIDIPLYESREINIYEDIVKVSYLEYLNNKARISFNKGVISSLIPYKSQWPIYFIIFTIMYIIASIIFISMRSKNNHKF